MAFLTWSLKRQILYIGIFIGLLGVVGFFILFPYFNKPPTCMDNKQNGDELGVDCGGSCANACVSQVEDMSVLWARAFRVIPGRYNAVAYVLNHNKNAAAQKVNYRFRFADANNVYIGNREGSTFVPPGGNFAIFEPGINIGNSIPVYVTFEFTEAPAWLQVSEEKISQLKVLVSNIELTDETAGPRLGAVIKNNSLFTIPDAGAVVILYDAQGNAVSASRTHVGTLAPLESTNIIFTWPEPFSTPVIAKEIIPMYDIFSVKLE